MSSNELFSHRYDWQNSTIKEIQKKINFYGMNTASRPIKAVAIYGSTQIGKTTLILYLLGIVEEEKLERISNILRADIKKGNSSTSTAIMYKKSSSNKFGVKEISDTTEVVSDFDEEFENEEQFKNKLKLIREDVENNQKKVGMTVIAIPQEYFKDDSEQNILIIDMPGDNSTTKEEKPHFDKLKTQILLSADVNIIACTANKITSLKTMVIKDEYDWRLNTNRNIVVVTHAFSQANIKSHISAHNINLLEVVKDNFEKEFEQNAIIDSSMEKYYFDLGDSLKGIKEECDDKKMIELLDEINLNQANHLKEAINRRKSNMIRSKIEELRLIIKTLKEQEEYEYKSILEQYNDEICDLKSFEIILSQTINKWKEEKNKASSKRTKENIDDVMVSVDDNQLAENINNIIFSKYGAFSEIKIKKEEFEQFKNFVIFFTEDNYYAQIKYKMKRSWCDIDDFIKKHKKNFGYKIPKGDLKDYIKYVIEFEYKKDCNLHKKNKAAKINEYTIQIDELSKKICVEEERQKETIQKRKKIEFEKMQKEDENKKFLKRINNWERILNNYLEEVKTQFMVQKNTIIQKLNSKEVDENEKVKLLLLLMLINEDYRRIIAVEG